MQTIVILGGSYGGVGTAHRLLKSDAKSPVKTTFKIILVTPSTHTYWNLAAVRAVLPGKIPDAEIFQEIAPGFKKYGSERFEFVLGTAESIDVEGKSVIVATGKEELRTTIKYDILILATGSRTKEVSPFKLTGSYQDTIALLHSFQEKVGKASEIIIGGAGPTGVEVAGELGYEYGRTKKITLVSSGDRVLDYVIPAVSNAVASHLKNVKVSIKLSSKITSHILLSSGQTELTLASGEKMTTDLYIPTIGLVPNSAYVPKDLLNADGFVVVDDFLRATGAKDVWAVGDVSAAQICSYLNVEKQASHLTKNILSSLKGTALVPYNNNSKVMLFASVGKKAGSGQIGNITVPSFMVAMVKGKTLFRQKLVPTVDGSMY